MNLSHLPEPLISSLRNAPGFDEKAFTEIHHSGNRVTSVRFNPWKIPGESQDQARLKNIFFELPVDSRVPWSENGYYLKERPLFYLDPLWHAGAYYVQEPSSMCIEFLLKELCDLSRPLRVLDLCAAPGGKSTLMAGLLSPESTLVSNEVISSRVNILEENISKWGLPNVIVTQNEARDFSGLKGFFDVILVDAPCSGSGLFRKDPDAIKEWSAEKVVLCSRRQKRILADIVPALRENGLLIYTTCSFSGEENEDIGDFLMQQFPFDSLSVPFNPDWGIIESYSRLSRASGYRFYPDRLKGEGLFLACFKKRREEGNSIDVERKKKNVVSQISRVQKAAIEEWINETNDPFFFLLKEDITAFPKSDQYGLMQVLSHLKIISAGIRIGRIMGKDLIPDHALAVSIIKDRNIPSLSLDLPDAVKYLRKDSFIVNEVPPGWTLAAYRGYGLGWLKGIRSRLNNYYPVNWRIRK